MKKILLCLFSVLCVFTLIGCGDKKDEKPVDPTPTPNPEVEDYDLEIKNYLDEFIPNEVTENIELPNSHTFEDETFARISWETSNERTIKDTGRYTKNLFDEEIVLTGTVKYYDVERPDYKYTKTVKTEGKEDLNEYKKIIEANLPDYVYRDFEVITKDATYKKYNLFGKITYTPSDTEVLSVDKQDDATFVKYVNMEPTDQNVDLNYHVVINGIEFDGKKAIKVEGRQDEKYLSAAKAYLDKYFTSDMIYDRVELPETDEDERVSFTWKSSNPVVLDDTGVLHVFEPNKTAVLTATINYNGTIQTWEKEFHTFKDGELVDFLMNRIHKDVIQQYVMHVYAYDADNYGYIPFYYQDLEMHEVVTDTTPNNTEFHYVKETTKNVNANKLELVRGIVAWDNKGRPQRMKPYTNVITVHDTGDAHHDAEWWNKYETGDGMPADDRQTSWNFTVGEHKIYQHIPIDEVAWHAGDGRTTFELLDTGVKFEGYNPVFTIGEDNYLYLNGKKTLVRNPYYRHINEETGKVDFEGYANDIAGSGLYTEIGPNGNYFMGDVYASGYSYGSRRIYVSTCGGNSTGIGIETDIHEGVDYNQVLRNCSNLVANLLVHFNLGPDRVTQHRHHSGKLCPQVMIENGTWPAFTDMIKNEYLIKKYLPNLKLEYTSNDPTILSNTGKVLKKVDHDTTVSYSVKATLGSEVKTFEFTTVIKPIVKVTEK